MKISWHRPDPALAAAGVDGEWLVARVRLVILALLLITPTWKVIHYPNVPVYIWGFAATLAGAVAAVAIWMRLMFGQWRRWIGFVSSTLDVSIVTAALTSFAIVTGPLAALNSNVTFEIYFLAIAATALRYDARICATVGMLAVAEYAALWGTLAWRYDLGDPALTVGVGIHSVADQATRLILLSAAVLLAYVYVRRAQRLLELASRDRLTGLYNRGHFDVLFAQEIELAERNHHALTVALLDLDHFKRINDTLGHATGDRVLIGIAARLAKGMRETDIIARYGGEEFAVLFRETDRNAAAARIELLRAQVAAEPLRVADTKTITVTCSAGIAEFRTDGMKPVVLIERADSRMFAAKRAGRDRAYSSEAA